MRGEALKKKIVRRCRERLVALLHAALSGKGTRAVGVRAALGTDGESVVARNGAIDLDPAIDLVTIVERLFFRVVATCSGGEREYREEKGNR